jgi:DNA-binding FadR family transcriptional regulator
MIESIPEDSVLSPRLVEQTTTAIRAFIQSRQLRPGDSLPSEAALSLSLGASRTTVREALSTLVALGIVSVGNGRRARVSTIDETVFGSVMEHAVHVDQVSILQVYDVRRTIEMRTVALAAFHSTPEEVAALKATAAAMRSVFASPGEVMHHDLSFHRAIASACRNPLFAILVASFEPVTRHTWPIGWESRRTYAGRLHSVALHEAIAAAIANRDPRSAETAMAEAFR